MKNSTKYLKIQSSFSEAIEYNKYATVQEEIVTKLIKYITSNKYDTILELGAGYGLLTNLVKSNLSYNNLYVNDLITKEHINLAGNMLEVTLPQSDLITSSSSLHWLEEDFNHLVKKVSKVQVSGCEFTFATFIKGNVYEVEQLGVGLKYYTVEELVNILSSYFDVEVKEVCESIKTFNTPISALREFKNTGTTLNHKVSISEIKNYKNKSLTYKYCILKCIRR